jgi:hypothetical protein
VVSACEDAAKGDIMNAAILIVGEDHALSLPQALLLKHWRTETATPAEALTAIAPIVYGLLIICQTVSDAAATELALQMGTLHPAAKVLIVNQPEQQRSTGSLQRTVEPAHPQWLPDAGRYSVRRCFLNEQQGTRLFTLEKVR